MGTRYPIAPRVIALSLALLAAVALWLSRPHGMDARECLLARTTASSYAELVEVMEECGDVYP